MRMTARIPVTAPDSVPQSARGRTSAEAGIPGSTTMAAASCAYRLTVLPATESPTGDIRFGTAPASSPIRRAEERPPETDSRNAGVATVPKNRETVELNIKLIYYKGLVVTGATRYTQKDFY